MKLFLLYLLAVTIIVYGIMEIIDIAHATNCVNDAVQQNIGKKRFGLLMNQDMANKICCNNEKYAEPSGYALSIGFFDKLAKMTEEKEHIFYDSQCGVPLFIAPRGRTLDEFITESKKHGWPSFRREEIVMENVRILPNERLESICGEFIFSSLLFC